MRFLDANVFIYAYYKPRRQLTQKERWMKDEAKEIIDGINQGREDVMMTVVQISEVVNILKYSMSLEQLIDVILGLFMLNNVKVQGISREAYFAATELGRDLKLDPNDALAVEVMRLRGVREIYSFDEDFDRLTRLPRL